MDVDDHVATIQGQRVIGISSEGRVQDGTVLRGVDAVAAEHGCSADRRVRDASEAEGRGDDLIGDQVLGQVDVEIACRHAQSAPAVGVSVEQLTQGGLTRRGGQRLDRSPLIGGADVHVDAVHGQSFGLVAEGGEADDTVVYTGDYSFRTQVTTVAVAGRRTRPAAPT